jgi:hypothetical protein
MKLLGAALFAGLALVVVAAASDVSGTWDVKIVFDDTRIAGGNFYCAFVQKGERITGSCSGTSSEVNGELKGQNISWRLQMRGAPPSAATIFTGTINDAGSLMTGRFTVADKGGSFDAKKI